MVKLASFRTITAIADRAPAAPPPAEPERAIRVVAWALVAAARRVRFRAVCIEQGLAAQVMLRRRGIAGTFHYGVRQGSAGLEAHVWVRANGHDVVGCDQANTFTEMACFGPHRDMTSAAASPTKEG